MQKIFSCFFRKTFFNGENQPIIYKLVRFNNWNLGLIEDEKKCLMVLLYDLQIL